MQIGMLTLGDHLVLLNTAVQGISTITLCDLDECGRVLSDCIIILVCNHTMRELF